MRIGSGRVLVEADDPALAVACSRELSELGFQVTVCEPGGSCPLVEGEGCPLVGKADVVLHALAPAPASSAIREALGREGAEVAQARTGWADAVFEAYAHRAARFRRRIRLRGGQRVVVRAIDPADAGGLQAFDAALSEESRRLRYLGYQPLLGDDDARRRASVDFRGRFAFVATARGRVVAECRLIPTAEGDAELAVAVGDGFQGRGLGARLLELAIAVAEARRFLRLVAEVRYDNRRMARLLRDHGFERVRWELGIMTFVRPLASAPRAPEQRPQPPFR